MHYRIVKGVQNKILLNAEKLLTDDGAHANIYYGTFFNISRHLHSASVRHTLSLSAQSQRRISITESRCKTFSMQEDKEC